MMELPTLRSGQVAVEDAAGTRQTNNKIVSATDVRAIERTNPADGPKLLPARAASEGKATKQVGMVSQL